MFCVLVSLQSTHTGKDSGPGYQTGRMKDDDYNNSQPTANEFEEEPDEGLYL